MPVVDGRDTLDSLLAAEWRREPGTYCLVLALPEPLMLCVGRLGRFTLPAGIYAYVGSAQGPGGVSGRVQRHLRTDKRLHWHIDALTAASPIITVLTAYDKTRLECAWARTVGALEGASAPIPGFGSSDCRAGCSAHLLRLPDDLSLTALEDELTRCLTQST